MVSGTTGARVTVPTRAEHTNYKANQPSEPSGKFKIVIHREFSATGLGLDSRSVKMLVSIKVDTPNHFYNAYPTDYEFPANKWDREESAMYCLVAVTPSRKSTAAGGLRIWRHGIIININN